MNLNQVSSYLWTSSSGLKTVLPAFNFNIYKRHHIAVPTLFIEYINNYKLLTLKLYSMKIVKNFNLKNEEVN